MVLDAATDTASDDFAASKQALLTTTTAFKADSKTAKTSARSGDLVAYVLGRHSVGDLTGEVENSHFWTSGMSLTADYVWVAEKTRLCPQPHHPSILHLRHDDHLLVTSAEDC